MTNTAVRYLADHPAGEPTPDREPPGTESTDPGQAAAERAVDDAAERADPDAPPAESTSVDPESQPGHAGADRHQVVRATAVRADDPA